MKKVNTIGKVIIAMGVLNLFQRIHGFYGFGGYVDNAWEILLISLVLIVTGLLMVLLTKKAIKD